jgi:hypothetical protein
MILADDAVSRNRENGTLFFDSSPAPPAQSSDDEMFFAFGYPSRLNTLLCTDKIEAVELSQVRVDGSWLPPRSQDELHGLKINLGLVVSGTCAGDFDGFSGGPVFSVHYRRKAVELKGVIMRGGGGLLYFAPAAWIDSLCDG